MVQGAQEMLGRLGLIVIPQDLGKPREDRPTPGTRERRRAAPVAEKSQAPPDATAGAEHESVDRRRSLLRLGQRVFAWLRV
jgi:hypothetical protein